MGPVIARGLVLEGATIIWSPLFHYKEKDMAQTRRIFDGEDYLRRMNDAAFAAELDRIDHYTAEDDTPDQRKFKNYVRDLQADITQVRLAAWKAHNRGMTSFEIPEDVDHSIRNFIASAEFAVKAGVI